MPRLALLLLAMLLPSAAQGALRATYAMRAARPMVIEIADDGAINAQLAAHQRLIIREGRAYLVQDRLTGPLVSAVDDLTAVATERPASTTSNQDTVALALVDAGPRETAGRTGRAYASHQPDGSAQTNERSNILLSDGPSLAILGAAMHQVFDNYDAVGVALYDWPPGTMRQPWPAGAPRQFGNLELRSVTQVAIPADHFALPAPPETREALRTRLAIERAEDSGQVNHDNMIRRALFADGRLWLMNDGGRLASLGPDDRRRTYAALDEPVLDICVANGQLLAVTGGANSGAGWTVRAWQGGSWQSRGRIARQDEALVGLACDGSVPLVLTTRRLTDLAGDGTRFPTPLTPALVSGTFHVTPDAVYFGLNRGEWGGGLRRIDRRTGAVANIERNESGSLCGGPINTGCDPVHAIVPIPWRPECLAVAIGLEHMMEQGRIASVCPAGITELFSTISSEGDPDAHASHDQTEAFFALAARDGALIALGPDGIYRLTANGQATHEPLPRFTEVDGLLVSFARPDMVLVITGINGRASLSGAVPLMAVR